MNRSVVTNQLINAKEREMNWYRNGQNIKKYLKQPKESIDGEGKSMNLKAADLPSLSDNLVPILIDIDPDQDIEEAYKHKKNQVFSWRFLRSISFVDLVNFHGRPEMQKQFNKFEGNIEEQAMIMYNKHQKKNIDTCNNGEDGTPDKIEESKQGSAE